MGTPAGMSHYLVYCASTPAATLSSETAGQLVVHTLQFFIS
uniref:Uncharacterized protein n=1 Tax=Anguilla anguilla TaxID=7936 RepID=A0A0E9QJ63_ANGAN